jgi:antirestriction protein ArdC
MPATKKTVYDIVTDKICAELEKGVAPWNKPWIGGESAPANLLTRRPYTGINPLLLSISGYTSPYWLTYKQAATLGGNVRKGEKSATVVFFSKIKSKTKTLPNGEPDTFAMLRYYHLFNVAQCDGISEHVPVPVKNEIPPLAAAETVVAGFAGRPTIVTESAAWYHPGRDVVGMPPKETFISAEGYYSTLFHELVHSTGHESRLGRHDKKTTKAAFGSETYSKEELVAEIGAAFLCADAGIDNTIPQSAAYCQSWLNALKNDTRLIVSAASHAGKAARHITGA